MISVNKICARTVPSSLIGGEGAWSLRHPLVVELGSRWHTALLKPAQYLIATLQSRNLLVASWQVHPRLMSHVFTDGFRPKPASPPIGRCVIPTPRTSHTISIQSRESRDGILQKAQTPRFSRHTWHRTTAPQIQEPTARPLPRGRSGLLTFWSSTTKVGTQRAGESNRSQGR